MSAPFTRRQLRDKIRHKLGRATALDVGLGMSGDPSPNDLKFSNFLLNDAIEETISDLNVECGIGGGQGPISIAVDAQTANGPLTIDIATQVTPRDSATNAINRVWFNDGTNNIGPLVNSSYRRLDLDGVDFYSTPPSLPSEFWVKGYTLWIYPAPYIAGTIFALVDTALASPVNDGDVIAQLPGDLNWVVISGAALRICGTQPNDAVMANNAAILTKEFDKGILKVKKVLSMLNGQYQGGFTIGDEYREYRGMR